MLSRLMYILMLKASNSSHDTPRKEEFHSRIISMNTFCCGLTSILCRSQITEVIDIYLSPRFYNLDSLYYDSYMSRFHQLIAIIPSLLLPPGMR